MLTPSSSSVFSRRLAVLLPCGPCAACAAAAARRTPRTYMRGCNRNEKENGYISPQADGVGDMFPGTGTTTQTARSIVPEVHSCRLLIQIFPA